MQFIWEDTFQKWKIVFSVWFPSSENRSCAYLLLLSNQMERSSSFRNSSDFLAEAADRRGHMITWHNKNGFQHTRVFAELLSESYWAKWNTVNWIWYNNIVFFSRIYGSDSLRTLIIKCEYFDIQLHFQAVFDLFLLLLFSAYLLSLIW